MTESRSMFCGIKSLLGRYLIVAWDSIIRLILKYYVSSGRGIGYPKLIQRLLLNGVIFT
jgi:hypothetical protein